MKLMPVAIALFLVSLLAVPVRAAACGTIPGWVKVYFDTEHENQPLALAFIHCTPIVEEQYKATLAQHKDLARMIVHALDNGDECDRNLAVKNFYIYDQLFWLRGTEVHDEIKSQVAVLLGLPDSTVMAGTVPLWDWKKRDIYCKTVARQIAAVKGLKPFQAGRGRKIDLSRLKKKAAKVDRILGKTDKCLSVKSNPADVELLRVTGNNLALRSKQTTKSKALKRFKLGTFLRVLKFADNGWAHVIDRKCTRGWVAVHRTKDARGD